MSASSENVSCNRINLVHNKALADTNNEISFNTSLGNFTNATKLTLTGYQVAGSSGALPNHLMLRLSNGSNQTYNLVQQGRNKSVDVVMNWKMLFPASGSNSQLRAELLKAPKGAPINVQGMRMFFETYNPTTEQYEKYTDYTEIAMEFEIEMHSFEKAVARA